MDLQGYERVCEALETAGIEAKVLPVPEAAQDVPYVTIRDEVNGVVHAVVMNALDDAEVGPNRALMNRHNGPELVPVEGLQTGTNMTFLDKLSFPG